ncbi:2-succinyl-5-enolpyruvyl-6-hydroxy-3-cyclohexene-1-carboxylic-acid synthase, partial [Agrococcus casei]
SEPTAAMAASSVPDAGQHYSAGQYSARLIAALIACGVTDLVVCPGSRSQALALAAAAQERAGRIRLHVRIDERSAAFFALGLARETGVPAPVVVTSGTAVANLVPAVLEAHHSDVPMLLLTADRPAELQGVRANQTTDQATLFSGIVRAARTIEADALTRPDHDARAAFAAAIGASADHVTDQDADPGPVQLNVRLREPLSDADMLAEPPTLEAPRRDELPEIAVAPKPGTVVLAGADALRDGQDPNLLAQRLSVPLIAEPSSGARLGRECVSVQLLETELAAEVRRVIVFGHPTLSRSTARLLATADEVLVAARAGENLPGTPLRGRLTAASTETDRSWLGRWVVSDRKAREAAEEPLSIEGLNRRELAKEGLRQARRPVDRETLVRSVWEHTWPHDRLVLGASRLIRVLDRTVTGKAITVHSNRGLAGIDGTIATGLGVAAALDRSARGGVTRILVGDITALHDAASLLVNPAEQRPRVQIVIGDDGGGTIFDDLEVRQSADEADFTRVLTTPVRADFKGLAEAYGWAHVLVTDRAGLERALTEKSTCVIEVRLHEEPSGD